MSFQMKHFFWVGRIVFAIVLIASVFTIYTNWEYSTLPSKISSIAMLFFYVMLIMVFHKNYKDLDKTPNIPEKDVEEAIKEEFE